MSKFKVGDRVGSLVTFDCATVREVYDTRIKVQWDYDDADFDWHENSNWSEEEFELVGE